MCHLRGQMHSLILWRATSSLDAWTVMWPQLTLLGSWAGRVCPLPVLALCCSCSQCTLFFPGQMLLVRDPLASEGYRERC